MKDFACAGSLQPAAGNTPLLRTVTIFNIGHISKQVSANMRGMAGSGKPAVLWPCLKAGTDPVKIITNQGSS